ncbi:MAG: hypothetical protein M3Z75_17510 [Actinomycetota bacterium]|nr:hypothetical protein [Actinomycetota bacterium]
MPTYDAALTSILDREPAPPGGLVTSELNYRAGDVECRGTWLVPRKTVSVLVCFSFMTGWV